MSSFIQINFLLALTGLLFVSYQFFCNYFGSKISSVKQLRFAQVLFVLAVGLPLLLKLVPESNLAGMKPATYEVYAEDLSALPMMNAKHQTAKIVEMTTSSISAVNTTYDLEFWLMSFWIVGLVFFLLRFLRSYFFLSKKLVNATPLRQNLKIKIVASSEVFVPFSVRMLSSFWIVVPETTLTHKQDLRLAIKHEMQHHRQGDTWWALAMEFVGCFLYFNPAIYLWKNIIIELQEYACDEALAGQEDVSSHEYGSCLLRVAEAALNNRQRYAGTASMAAIVRDSNYFKKFLLRRIEMIMEEKTTKRTWLAYTLGFTLTLASMAVAIATEKLVRFENGINPGKVSVDKDVQKIADDALKRAMYRTKSTAGFIIVAEPSTGKVLAVANVDLKGNRKGHWALNELIEAASIIKPIVAGEAIEQKLTDSTTKHDTENGTYKYNGEVYRDWKDSGWDSLTTTEIIERSSNIGAIKMGEALGEKNLSQMLTKFGFGNEGTASSFPEAKIGEVPSNTHQQFIPQASVGFGYRVSALEILQAYGAIANGGHLMKPIQKNQKESVLRRVLSTESAQKVRIILTNVIKNGTGKNADSDLYTTAGKTASTRLNEFRQMDWKVKQANYAGFIGFAPVSKPKIEVFVGLMNADTDGSGSHGGEHAAPVFKEVIENVLTHFKVSPDK